jgi:hypothetical protein
MIEGVVKRDLGQDEGESSACCERERIRCFSHMAGHLSA